MPDAIRSVISRYREFILYCLIGATGATLDFLIFLALTAAGLDPLLATTISVSCGIVNNFVWNAWINFQVRTHLMLRFLSFYMIGVCGVVLSVIIIGAGNWLDIDPVVSKAISIPLVVASQFALNRTLTFRRRPKTAGKVNRYP